MIEKNECPTNTMFPYGCAWGLKERISSNDFYDTIIMDFDGRKVSVFRNYDKYLSTLYGDYMTPPSEGAKCSGHVVSEIRFEE